MPRLLLAENDLLDGCAAATAPFTGQLTRAYPAAALTACHARAA